MLRVLLLNGPNINALGRREPQLYGSDSLEDIVLGLRTLADNLGVELECCQSSFEGELIDRILVASGQFNFIILNPGAFTHTSIALRDAIAASDVPVLEVHITNIYAREEWRNKSVISPVCCGVIAGVGVLGYRVALETCYYLYCSLRGEDIAVGIPAGLPSAPEVRSGGFTILDDDGGETSVSANATPKFRLRDAIAEIDGKIEQPSSYAEAGNRSVVSSDRAVPNRGVINADILNFGAGESPDGVALSAGVDDDLAPESAVYGLDGATEGLSAQGTVAEDVDMVITRRSQALERASQAEVRNSVAVGISDEAKRARRAAVNAVDGRKSGSARVTDDSGAVDAGGAANRAENTNSGGEIKKRKVNLALNFGQRPTPQRDTRGREAEEHRQRTSLELRLPATNAGVVADVDNRTEVYAEPELPVLEAGGDVLEGAVSDVEVASGTSELAGGYAGNDVALSESSGSGEDGKEDDAHPKAGWRSFLDRRKKKR